MNPQLLQVVGIPYRLNRTLVREFMIFAYFLAHIAPICLCVTLTPPLVPQFNKDQLLLKGIHPRMNPLQLLKNVLTYCWNTIHPTEFLIFDLFWSIRGHFGLVADQLHDEQSLSYSQIKVSVVVYLNPRCLIFAFLC